MNIFNYIGDNLFVFAIFTILGVIALIPAVLRGKMKDTTHLAFMTAGCLSVSFAVFAPLLALSLGAEAFFITIPMALMAFSPQGRMMIIDIIYCLPRSIKDGWLSTLHKWTASEENRHLLRRKRREQFALAFGAKENHHCE